MRKYLQEACESVDSSVFNGDFLFDPDERAEFREYLERWQRALAKHDGPPEGESLLRSIADALWGEDADTPWNPDTIQAIADAIQQKRPDLVSSRT